MRLQTLQELTQLVTSTLDIDAIIAAGLNRLTEFLGVMATSLWVLTPDGERLQLAGSLGFPEEFHE